MPQQVRKYSLFLLLAVLLIECWFAGAESEIECGYQYSEGDSLSTTDAGLKEFPWTAILLYEDETDKKIRAHCSGSLIDSKYVLTTATCVRNYTQFHLVAVRLGEYNVTTANDCSEDACIESPKDFAVEKALAHPKYNPKSYSNDIALLRLNESVEFSDSIRPICLPPSQSSLSKPGDILLISGWGRTEQSTLAETKKKVLSELISNEECISRLQRYGKYLTEDHMCTIDLANSTQHACSGDSGAPVMFYLGKQWYQEGISSFGVGCNSGIPDVNTKVASYVDWIKENMKD